MTNEEFQELVLKELRKHSEQFDKMNGEITGINGNIEGINEEIIGIKGDINGVKGQLDENTQILKAIQHNQEFSNAKLECIELTTAKAQSLSKLDDKFEALNKRLFAQEAEIQGLKRVK